MIRWSPGLKRANNVLLMAAIPLAVTKAASVPSIDAIARARACGVAVHALMAGGHGSIEQRCHSNVSNEQRCTIIASCIWAEEGRILTDVDTSALRGGLGSQQGECSPRDLHFHRLNIRM